MSDHTDKAPRKGSSEKSPTKFMERPGAKPHPENELTRDRYQEGSNSEVAGLYADPRSDQDAAEIRESGETKILPKKAPKKAGDPTLKKQEVEDDEDEG
jgi:hypothetical protein